MSREQRKLAAILQADAVGYSRLMGRDEAGTLARLREHRKRRFEPALARHGGRLVKLTGDGALAEFPSAVDALSAAIEFQQTMADANHSQPEDVAIVFRIGLHLGDVIVEGDDLYGDGINIAARLEAEAPPGGIVISRNVRDAVARRLKADFKDLGPLALKNIEKAVRAFDVSWDATDWQVTTTAAGLSAAAAPLALPDKPSIAVLPFQNMSGDPEQEYFADGLAEDIITALSRFKSLFVIARNSSFTYKGRTPDIRQVGRELGVRYVLEGSVRKAGGRVRITGQLIDSDTGAHLWADRFDGSLEDVFDLQDQVTTSVVGAIAPRLDQAEIERTRRKPIDNLDAYDCYLRGMALAQAMTRESLDAADRLFRQSTDLDPTFSAPYGLTAKVITNRWIQGWGVDHDQDQAMVQRLASRLSEIGSDDALALCWVGFALVHICRADDGGAAQIDRALAINPNLAAAWANRGTVNMWLGQHEAALQNFPRSLLLNPIDPEVYRAETWMAQALVHLGRYDEALSLTQRALARQPKWMAALRASAVANVLAGNIDVARSITVRMRELDPTTCISEFRRRQMPLRRPQDVERYIDGLRLAGLPE